MLFNSISRNVNVTILCITNTLTMLYAANPESEVLIARGEGGGGRWRTRSPLFEFSGSAPETFLIIPDLNSKNSTSISVINS